MRDFDDTTLWRISAFERWRDETGTSGFAKLDDSTVLPTTLNAELSLLQKKHLETDVLEVVAACVRQRESALILLRHHGLLWPLTLFPQNNLYHLPRAIIGSLETGNRDLEVLSIEPPGLRPPGHRMHERIADGPGYRLLPPLLWALALYAPRAHLLDDIAGRAAYRVSADFVSDGLIQAGVLGPVLQRLRHEIASIREIARWPGMDPERAERVLNGIYLQGGLIVLRSPRAARNYRPAGPQSWFRLRR